MYEFFIYERLSPEMETYLSKLRQQEQTRKCVERQQMERYDNYLK